MELRWRALPAGSAKNTVAEVKQHYNMKESGKKRQQQMVLMELSPGKRRFRLCSSKKE